MAFRILGVSPQMLASASLALMLAASVVAATAATAQAGSGTPASRMFKKRQLGVVVTKQQEPAGKATTVTEVVDDGSVSPFLLPGSAQTMQAVADRYAKIVSSGGWPEVPRDKMKKGSTGKTVAILNRRLYVEGYLRREAVDEKYAETFTTATDDAVKRFQRYHGLAVTGVTDKATLAELNVPAGRRLAAIRANIPRLAEYSKDLGSRYVVVNVPAQQIEKVSNGRVYSRHNAIVGRPSRPTPVVMTPLTMVRFNPYWNAPASIVERDIVPRMLSGSPSKVLRSMNIKVFQGVGGPEIDPDKVDWRRAVVDNYHFRQEPGGDNAMATAKIEFNSPFGIYLHDTPEPHLFASGERFYSSGCVRVEKVATFINWILQGQDGIDRSRIAQLADTKERLDEKIVNPPQLRVTYLTAWPTKDGVSAFRRDVYELDGTGFVVGQPLPVGEKSSGQRFVLKPIPRSPDAVDADEAVSFGSLFNFMGSPEKTSKTDSRTSTKVTTTKVATKMVVKTSGAKHSKTLATAKKSANSQCKAGKGGKLPAGCSTAKTTKRPAVKVEQTASAAN